MTLRDGVDWLKQAFYLLLHHPRPFLAAALLAPAGSALLLMLPVWDVLPAGGGWLAVISTVICYGFPLTLTICLATGLARAVNQGRSLSLPQLLVPAALKVLLKSSAFLFALLLQGYLAVYLIRDLVSPAAILASVGEPRASLPFAVADTVLGAELMMIASLLLVLQLLFAFFITPLHLFRELPLYTCWRLSFIAMQLNVWLIAALGVAGLLLILLSHIDALAILAQLLALPLPVYLGALLYIAWREVFQGDDEKEALAAGKAIA